MNIDAKNSSPIDAEIDSFLDNSRKRDFMKMLFFFAKNMFENPGFQQICKSGPTIIYESIENKLSHNNQKS